MRFKGENLTNLRILHNLSQSALSERSGIKVRDIWQYENGYKSPLLEDVNKLNSIFNVKSGYFYSSEYKGDKRDRVSPAYISIRRP